MRKKAESNPKKLHPKEELTRLAKKHHLILDLNKGEPWKDYYELITPDGYKFLDGTHGRVEPHRGDAVWKKEAINDLVEFILGHEKYKQPLLTRCKKGCECGWDE